MSWCLKMFVLLAPYVCFRDFGFVWVTEWPPIGKIAAHSADDIFSWNKYLGFFFFFFFFFFVHCGKGIFSRSRVHHGKSIYIQNILRIIIDLKYKIS